MNTPVVIRILFVLLTINFCRDVVVFIFGRHDTPLRTLEGLGATKQNSTRDFKIWQLELEIARLHKASTAQYDLQTDPAPAWWFPDHTRPRMHPRLQDEINENLQNDDIHLVFTLYLPSAQDRRSELQWILSRNANHSTVSKLHIYFEGALSEAREMFARLETDGNAGKLLVYPVPKPPTFADMLELTHKVVPVGAIAIIHNAVASTFCSHNLNTATTAQHTPAPFHFELGHWLAEQS